MESDSPVLEPTVSAGPLGSHKAVSRPAPPAESLARGATVGRYVILDRLGAGGMGVVYRAYDPDLHRRLAIKVVWGRDGATLGSARMLREAQAMAQLAHPNVVAIHDVGTFGDDMYIAMELVDGTTLTRWHEDEHAWTEVLEVYLQAARGLIAAHSRALVHRDFKPDNVMIDGSGRVRVMDFGLARVWGVRGPVGTAVIDDDDGPSLAANTPLMSDLTHDGAVIGTPAYMAPEQYAGQPADARTDQFSFCVALWEALHGQRPFAGQGIPDLAARVRAGQIAEPEPSKVPEAVDRALRRGLSSDPEDRWPSLEALRAELAARLAPRRPIGRTMAAAAGVVALGGVAAFVLQPDSRCTGADEAVAEVWNDARAQAIAMRFADAGGDEGAQIWARQREHIDGWTRRWGEAHEEACRATTIRGEQTPEAMELRMGCLRRARVELDAALQVLGGADATAVHRADDVLGALPKLDRCDDVDALGRDEHTPAPELADDVLAVRHQVAEAYAHLRVAHVEDALAVARRAEATATELGWDPVIIEALFALLQAQELAADVEGATANAKRMLRLASRNDQWGDVVAASAKILYLVGHQQARPEEALAMAELALGAADRIDDKDAEARLYSALGGTYVMLGRLDEADTAFRRALKLRRETPGAPDEMIATEVSNVASIAIRTGRLQEGLDGMQEALTLFTGALGPEHPMVGNLHNNVAAVLEQLGRMVEAAEHNRRALEILEASLPPNHPDVLTAKGSVAVGLAYRGEAARAQAMFEEVAEGLAAELGPTHPETSFARCNVAELMLQRGRAAEAERLAEQAWTDYRATVGEHTPGASNAARLLAEARLHEGDADGALEPARAAVQAAVATAGEEDASTLRARVTLADIDVALGRLDEAHGELRAAASAAESADAATGPAMAVARVALGELLVRRGDEAEARTELQAGWDAIEGASRPDRARAAFALARALWSDEAERPRARQLAEEALELRDEGDAEARRAVRDWLDTHPS